MAKVIGGAPKHVLPFWRRLARDLKVNRKIYFIALICLSYYFIFCYGPMAGITIAFRDYRPARGIFGSTWVGLKYFQQFISSHYFFRLIRNTFLISVYDLVWAFPAPIILALLLNEITRSAFRRAVQTVTYLPHFVSQVIICGILINFLGSEGLINQIFGAIIGHKTMFLQDPKYFRTIYIASGIWQHIGYSSIIFLSALSSVDVELIDAAAIDGCNRFRRVWHVTLPGITPTIVILLILRMGSMMSVGFEKVILLYNANIYETADVISSFVYRYGMQQGNFSYSTAVGLLNSVINFILLIIVNHVSKRVSEISLW